MYKCPFCGEVFLREHDFNMHVIKCPKQHVEPVNETTPEEPNEVVPEHNVETKKEVKVQNKAGKKGKR